MRRRTHAHHNPRIPPGCGAPIARRLIIVGLALLGTTVACSCRSREPAVRRGIRNVEFERVHGYLEYTFRQRRRNQESKVGAGSTNSKERIHEENIQLETEGFVYHPNFLEFTLAGLFGLTQQDFLERFDGRERQSGDDGDVYEFDLSAAFFKQKEYPGTVFARRHRALTPRPFQSSLETTTTHYGFVWQYVDEKMPTSVQFNDTEVLLNPLDDREDNGRQQTTEFRFDTTYKFNVNNTLSLIYEWRSEEEEPFGLSFDSSEVTLTHRLDFGERHEYRLESEFNYFNQKGTFDIERLRWREILRIMHTDSLDSWYRFELTDRTQGTLSGVPPIEERAYLTVGTVEYRLFDSVVTQFTGVVQNQEFGSGLTIRRYAAQARLEYRKKNPWGLLRASFRDRFQREKRRGGGLQLETIDERRTFRDPDPIRLSNPNVVKSSIFMTAEDRTTFYMLGRDYTFREVGDFLELERVPTGRIAEGQIVLIDYVYRVGGDLILETLGRDFSLRQDFDNGWSPYYRFRWQDQELRPKKASGVTPDDITAHLIGVEFKRGAIRLMAEYEDHDSTISPSRTKRLSIDWTHRFQNRAATTLKARWSEVHHAAPSRRTLRFMTLEGRYRHDISRGLNVEAAVMYRNQQDSLSGDDEGIDADLTLEWTVRETELRLIYEWSKFNDDYAKSDSSSLFVQLRRRF